MTLSERISSRTRHLAFDLDGEGIDGFCAQLAQFQQEAGVERKDRMRAILLLETALLKLRDQLGDGLPFDAFFERRSFKRPRVRIVVAGDPFNPLVTPEQDDDGWADVVFSSLELHPRYSYVVDANTLTLALPTPAMNPVVKTALAILLGICGGIVGTLAIPNEARSAATTMLLNPIYDIWIRLLGAISGPIIFCNAATATMNTRRITDRGGSGLALLTRYFVQMALIIAGVVPLCWTLLPLGVQWTTPTPELVGSLLGEAVQVFPDNLVDPFIEANTPQLLLCAFVIGKLLNELDAQAKQIRSLVRQATMIGLAMAQWVSLLVPYFVGMFICLEIWNRDYGLLVRMWQPLLVSVFVSLVAMSIALAGVAIWTRAEPRVLGRKLCSQFLDVLKVGSIDMPIDELAKDCRHLLGIDQSYARAAMPQGLNLYMPISAVGIYVFCIFVASAQGVQVDQMWILHAAVMSVVLFVATPPVAGANLIAYVALFAYQGIASSALMDAMVFDIVFGVFANAANLFMLELEVILQARRAGFLDEKAFRRPSVG